MSVFVRSRQSHQTRNRDNFYSADNVRDVVVADMTFGKARVTCSLRGKHCTWGRLDEENGAVLQIVTDLDQENGFKLSQAILEVSFMEHDPAQDHLSPTGKLCIPEIPSPRSLKGIASTQHVNFERVLNPNLPLPQGNFQVGSVKSTKDLEIHRSWVYHSHRPPDQYNGLTIAKWNWEANRDNPEIEDVGQLHSGVVLQYPGGPFWVGCKVRGKLVSVWRRFKYGHREDELPKYTEIRTPSLQSNVDIQPLADDLENKMIELNASAAAGKLPTLDKL